MARFSITHATWVACLFALGAGSASAARIADANLFSGPGVTGITATTNTTFANAAFTASNLVDRTNKSFVFLNANESGTPAPLTQFVSISGFNSSIDSLRFFDTPSYNNRTANTVKIYYSATAQTSLSAANYTQLVGPGVAGAFAIATVSNFYTTATSPIDNPNPTDPGAVTTATIRFSSLTGLNIPSGTRGLLLDFSRSSTQGFGDGLTEIQAFAIPEPTTAGVFAVGAAGLAFRRRRRHD